MDAQNLKNNISERAKFLGFSLFGVSSAENVDEKNTDFFKNWLSNKMHDEMYFLERNPEKRLSPRLLFEGANSVLVFGANFFRETQEKRVALYAQSADYHGLLKSKLKELAEVLKAGGYTYKICVDTSPILEKYFAIKAGIGWLGKNTLLINKENGPWQFLGLILTDAKLPADKPQKSLCGSCAKCVEACPSGALAPYVLDARRCISNLTIERKTPLTEGEKEMCRDKLFGCDDCLRACPFGKNAPKPLMPELRETILLDANASEENIAQFIPSKRAGNLNLRLK